MLLREKIGHILIILLQAILWSIIIFADGDLTRNITGYFGERELMYLLTSIPLFIVGIALISYNYFKQKHDNNLVAFGLEFLLSSILMFSLIYIY